MDNDKVVKAYKFALTESVRLFNKDKTAFNHIKLLGSLAHVHLMQQGIDAQEIMDEILGSDED